MTPSRRYKGKIAKFEEKLKAMHVGAGNWQEVDAKGHVRFVPLSAQIKSRKPTTRRLLAGVTARVLAARSSGHDRIVAEK